MRDEKLPSYIGIIYNKPLDLFGGNSHIFLFFLPRKLGFHDPIWFAHIFQNGLVKNHQLDTTCFFLSFFPARLPLNLDSDRSFICFIGRLLVLWFLRFFLKQASISSMWNAKITPSKTNIAPETQGWKMSFLLGRPSSRCHVSCWECNIQTPRCAMPRRTKPIRISAGMHWWWRPHKKWALFLGYQMGGCITNKNPSRNDKPTTWKKNFQPWIFSFQKKHLKNVVFLGKSCNMTYQFFPKKISWYLQGTTKSADDAALVPWPSTTWDVSMAVLGWLVGLGCWTGGLKHLYILYLHIFID